ncbi:nuclear pore complex protein NUP205 isoform X2 [Nymphaea colorata]|uniref:nuclear pore complex protein NUP205 isoform X2 n=1 Tax=Nymphaea colorata TaxID=210225 RepID=UPI00129E3034|nr:nuclear pore complex protein NUP205 isoform X2 [Nymphaea colorata]
MVSPKALLATVESTLLGPSGPTPRQRVELMHALRDALPVFRSFLSYTAPKPSDRTQVMSKEVRLQDVSPSLDDLDVQIALKLSDELNLNEIDCVSLLVHAHQEWDLFGREPSEIFRLAAGLWYTERRALITSLYTLLRAVVLDQGLEPDIVSDIQCYLEDLFKSGLRQRLISLMKELSRAEAATSSGQHQVEQYVMDSRGALVKRNAVVLRERLTVGHCLAISVLVVRPNSKDVKDMFFGLKESIAEVTDDKETQKLQIVFSLLFGIVISFISDALSTAPDKTSILCNDTSFRREFQELMMSSGNDQKVEEFIGAIRLTWTVHLMLTSEENSAAETASITSCLELVCSRNAFQILLDKILRTAAYQNDDDDMVYMYTAYMHKLVTCFLSNPIARDKVKEMKEKAMSSMHPYLTGGPSSLAIADSEKEQISQTSSHPFISLLELVSEIYEKEPEHLAGNEVIWTFVNFAGEDHTNFQTLVAFLRMMSSLASNEEGAFKVFQLLQRKAFRSVSWTRLFDCLSMYEQKFKQSLQTSAAVLPEFQEGDAKAMVAYLRVLQKVMQKGNPLERSKWFPDIEPLFKLLGYENVPPFLKGALRNTITTFVENTPILKDTIWSFLERYDLPVVVGPPPIGNQSQQLQMQVYDMRYELNEVEARAERYPSTISFLNLLNALVKRETDTSDRGLRFLGVFRFVYDHVFGPFPRRAYAEPAEKWQLVVACLQHFQILLTLYNVKEMDIENIERTPQQISSKSVASPEQEIPVLELLKDFMSGRTAFSSIMGILLQGVNAVISDRASQVHGPLLEKAVLLSLEIILLVFDKDLFLADFWRPLCQPLDVILSQDRNMIVALLEYVRYDFLPQIQQSSIKILSILSSRMVELVPLLLESGSADSLIEDYAACLEVRSEETQALDNISDDSGVLILQLLIDNISRPAPNLTHLLLKFDVDSSIERTALQPKYHYSCLRVILDVLETMNFPDVNASLHEFGFQLVFELCLDPLTGNAVSDLLASKKYQFFSKHLESFAVLPLPKRHTNHSLRVSSLQQRAWLLKLLAFEMHAGDVGSSIHKDVCLRVLSQLFARETTDVGSAGSALTDSGLHMIDYMKTRHIDKNKVLALLDIIQFRAPDAVHDYSQSVSNSSLDILVGNILQNPATVDKGGVYYFSERGDRLIDLASFGEKLCQMCNMGPQSVSLVHEGKIVELKNSIQQLLRWGWRYNRNLEEQAAQLHLLVAWSQLVEVSISRRMMFLENRSQILFEVLDATLEASASPDCSVKMSAILTQVAITCMAKLREERFLSPGNIDSDSVTCLDIVSMSQLSSAACQSILLKLIVAILRRESSELLRRRQYALLLNYFQYCQSMLDPDIPEPLLRFLLQEEQDGDVEVVLQKIDNEHEELDKANFFILKKEARELLDVIVKDAKHASEIGRTISIFVLDTLISIDRDQFFLSHLQSRGLLQSCLSDIRNSSFLDTSRAMLDSVQKLCTIEAEISLLVRISCKYRKSGVQILFSMNTLEHLTPWKALDRYIQGGFQWSDSMVGNDMLGGMNKQFLLVPAVLRLILCLTSLVDVSDFFEVKNKVVRDIVEFTKEHQVIFDVALREELLSANDSTLELVDTAVAIVTKVWPYDEHDDFGFVQALFGLMNELFSYDAESFHRPYSSRSAEVVKKSGFLLSRLCYSLISYLYFLIMRKGLKLQISASHGNSNFPGGQLQPTLPLVVTFLTSITTALFTAIDEKTLLLSKVLDINDLSRYEVDEIIDMFMRQDYILASDSMQKRRHVAMLEMCRAAGKRGQLIMLFLRILEHALNILFIHFQDSASRKQDIQLLCTNLLPTLEQLSLLNEEKVGHSLKVFHRLVRSLKELAAQRMEL